MLFRGRAAFIHLSLLTNRSYSFSAFLLWQRLCLASIHLSMSVAHLLGWHILALNLTHFFDQDPTSSDDDSRATHLSIQTVPAGQHPSLQPPAYNHFLLPNTSISPYSGPSSSSALFMAHLRRTWQARIL
jgi:hypothetical protein